MDAETLSAKDTRDLERMTKSIVEICVRNTGLEDLHAGRVPGLTHGRLQRRHRADTGRRHPLDRTQPDLRC
jgi:hypothetical protein